MPRPLLPGALLPGRSTVLPCLAFGLGAAALCVPPARDLMGQREALALPAAAVLAPVSAVLALLLGSRPGGARAVHDKETDVIVALPLLALGLWASGWLPGRLADHALLWRADLLGLALCLSALACLALGVRALPLAARSLVGLTLAVTPGVQLLAAGDDPSTVRTGVATALLAALPLLLSLRPGWRALATGALVVAIGGVLPSAGASGAAALLVAAAGALLPGPRRVLGPAVAPVRRGRSLGVVLLACALLAVIADGLSDRMNPVDPLPDGTALALGPAGTAQDLPGGLLVRSWDLPAVDAAAQSVRVLVTSGGSPAAVQTLPTDSLLAWQVAACPRQRVVDVAGQQALLVRYSEDQRGYRWSRFEWMAGGAEQAERVSLVLGQGPTGGPVPMPVLDPGSATRDAWRTGLALVANRTLTCNTGTPEVERGLVALAERVITERRAGS